MQVWDTGGDKREGPTRILVPSFRFSPDALIPTEILSGLSTKWQGPFSQEFAGSKSTLADGQFFCCLWFCYLLSIISLKHMNLSQPCWEGRMKVVFIFGAASSWKPDLMLEPGIKRPKPLWGTWEFRGQSLTQSGQPLSSSEVMFYPFLEGHALLSCHPLPLCCLHCSFYLTCRRMVQPGCCIHLLTADTKKLRYLLLLFPENQRCCN